MVGPSEKECVKLGHFIKTMCGINLEHKQQLIFSRLSTAILQHGYPNFSTFVDAVVEQRDPVAIELLLNRLTTNYTYFMREQAHFDYFKDTVLPWIEKNNSSRTLSIWSAGCSFGQEPYTLSILIKEFFKNSPKQWDTRILATDISNTALQGAIKGWYPSETIEALPSHWQSRYFRPVGDGIHHVVSDELKDNVIFRPFNLMDPIRFKLKFDVIFCRNVMIYFDRDTKEKLVSRFYDALNPDGYLFIGHTENFADIDTPFSYVMPSAYRKVGGRHAGRGAIPQK